MDEICEVIITAPDADWLAQFTRQLVVAAPGRMRAQHRAIRSIYRWEGEIYDLSEARVALHTRRSLVPEIVEQTNRNHPYKVPCVIATQVVDGNPSYIRWVNDETTAPLPCRWLNKRNRTRGGHDVEGLEIP